MFMIRLSFASVAVLAAALTTFVTVAPQPASARVATCIELPEPVLA